MEHKITINLEVRGSREPELYAGLHAIPEVCREVVIRGLLALAIRTPSHLVAASARSAGKMFDHVAIGDDPSITKKLTFQSARSDDLLLFQYFSQVPVGRRKQTVRALLMMGLLTQHAPQQDASALGESKAGHQESGPQRQTDTSLVSAPIERAATHAVDHSAPASSISADGEVADPSLDDLGELFDAISMKT